MKKRILLICIAAAFLTAPFRVTAQAVNTQDSLALVDLYNATDGPHWPNFNWLSGAPVSKWTNVKVTAGRVTYVSLQGVLKGSLPASIGNLTSLDTLNLSYGFLTGAIPASIANLNPIMALDLRSNYLNFSGMDVVANHFLFAKYSPQRNISYTINGSDYSVTAGGTLSDNTYTWYKNGVQAVVKTGDSTISGASYLDEYKVTITNSTVPNLTLTSINPLRIQDSLVLVNMYDSMHGEKWGIKRFWKNPFLTLEQWTGVRVRNGRVITIREHGTSFGQRTSVNAMVGNLPASIAKLTALDTLDLAYNYITGLPESLGTLPNLRYLNLSFNSPDANADWFSIPVFLSRIKSLTYLNMSQSAIPGSIPDSLGLLTNLVTLDLSGNRITGKIPVTFGGLAAAQTIKLYTNKLTDTIPASLGNLPLTLFLVDHNQLTGNLPASFNSLTNVVGFDVSNNQLSGTLPALGGNTTTGYYLLNNNQFSGSLPHLLRNNANTIFHLQSNNFSGDASNLVTDTGNHVYPADVRVLLDHNNFTFQGMEQLVKSVPGKLTYAPQNPVPIYRRSDSLFVSVGGTLANDTFRLIKDGVLVQAHIADSGFSISAPGRYVIISTNRIATALKLTSDTIEVAVLPVTLLSFTGARAKENILLNWLTAQEINARDFNVERSVNGYDFAGIGTVQATGNSAIAQQYSYVDHNVNALNTNTLYYRLKIVDKDGSFSYSRILSLQNDGAGKPLVVYPNPATSSCAVEFTADAAKKYIIAVTTVGGKLVKRINIAASPGSNSVAVDIHDLPAATYMISIISDKGTKTLKLVKQ